MERLTKKSDDKYTYIVDYSHVQHDENGYSGEAITKLAKFENFIDDLAAKQRKISEQLEQLRLDDKTHTVKFKQLLAEKLTNNNIIILLRAYGL